MVVRATSPKVPMCGSPDGPEPVSKIPSSFGAFFSRATILRASSNGQAFDCSASSRSDDAAGAAAMDMGQLRARTLGRGSYRVNAQRPIGALVGRAKLVPAK